MHGAAGDAETLGGWRRRHLRFDLEVNCSVSHPSGQCHIGPYTWYRILIISQTLNHILVLGFPYRGSDVPWITSFSLELAPLTSFTLFWTLAFTGDRALRHASYYSFLGHFRSYFSYFRQVLLQWHSALGDLLFSTPFVRLRSFKRQAVKLGMLHNSTYLSLGAQIDWGAFCTNGTNSLLIETLGRLEIARLPAVCVISLYWEPLRWCCTWVIFLKIVQIAFVVKAGEVTKSLAFSFKILNC